MDLRRVVSLRLLAQEVVSTEVVKMYHTNKLLVIVALTGLLTACGGGSGGSSDAEGTLSLSVFDAPVDEVMAVVVSFDGVTLKPQNGEQVYYDVAGGDDIDLLSLQGGNILTLLNGITVPAGGYAWAELHVTPSHVIDGMGGMVELTVPSGRLRLVSGFTVTVQQNTHVGLDWNVRRGLTDPVGQPGYHLTPAHRIVDMTAHGSISGTVGDGLVPEGCNPLVYVYEMAGVIPDDMDNADAEPITVAMVDNLDPEAAGAWTYSVPFLDPVDYTVAFTCEEVPDDPVVNNDEIMFQHAQSATVTDAGDTVVDFPPAV
jgi:hypothetical protein